jgi:UDP-N-acetylmuramoylalanine--D-glutamate ligase
MHDSPAAHCGGAVADGRTADLRSTIGTVRCGRMGASSRRTRSREQATSDQARPFAEVKPRPEIPGGPFLVVGLARSGAAAALALRDRAQQVIGLDAGSPQGTRALGDAGVQLHLDDEDGVALLDRVRAVVKSPGVPAQAAVVAAARERGIPVLGELELAWRLLDNEFVAVTGTNGKTTTVELIGHIHRAAGQPVAVAGNVGTAVSSLVGSLDRSATVVCEVSSFQLEDSSRFAPEAAVLLNVTPDHLDRHGTLDAYTAAKLRIFAHQDERDAAVLARELAGEIETGRARVVDFAWGPPAALFERDGRLWWQGEALIALDELRLRGRHNAENAMAAAAVCLARGIPREAVRAGLSSFAGVAHRLEEIATLDGVLYVNDSKATNEASTLVALDAFAGRGVHLIAGGQGKGQDFSALGEAVQRGCAGVYLIGEDAPTLRAALGAAPVRDCGDLAAALDAARAAARAGDVVLFSPACASFDQFADFEARGERFRGLVQAMQG